MKKRSVLLTSFGLALVTSACWHTGPAPEEAGGAGGAATTGSGGQAPLGGTGAVGGTAAPGTGGTAGTAVAGQSAAGGAGATGGAAAGGAGGATGMSGSGAVGTGGSGAAGAGATAGAPPMLMRGPVPPTATSHYPFPQNRQSASCIYPTAYDNADVQRVYDAWKADLVTSDGAGGFRRVKRPAEPGLNQNSTVSEGIGYGMIIAVYMDDQDLFDDLWRYELAHTWTYQQQGGGSSQTILMNWYILEDGSVANQGSGGTDGNGAATDADEDMAWALVQADKQWGGQGKLDKSYLDYAKQLLGDIWKYEIDNNRLPKNGSSWGGDNSLNISYFAPAYYRVFAKVTGEQRWGKDVVDYIYQVIDNNLNDSNGNKENGLVPAFSQANGSPAAVGPGQGGLAFNYQYDSCRTPFRIGLDACWSADTRATGYVAKTTGFFGGIGAANIVDGYELNGTPKPQYPDNYNGLSAAFIGPAGVGAMSSSGNQQFVDDVWNLLKQNNMWCGGQYYDESWTMMSMLMLSGNFLDYTSIQ